MDPRGTRREYQAAALARNALPEDPLDLFHTWLNEAVDAGAKDATAMALATTAGDGTPSVRIVLLKEFGQDGFVWYTDYRSQKGTELDENPVAAAVFYWRDFDHQVRVTGPVGKVTAQTSDEYFRSRPAESRFSAAASEQSQPVADRRTLEERVEALRDRYPDDDVPMPTGWGGYCLKPTCIEFWQGREGRLHDRFRYQRDGEGWQIHRLQP